MKDTAALCTCIIVWCTRFLFSESVISVTSSTRLITTRPDGFVSILMEVNPSSPTYTGYWTMRGLDGIERTIVIDDIKYMLMSTERIMIYQLDANDVGFYTLCVTNGVDSGHNESPVIVKLSGVPSVASNVTEINETPSDQTIVIPCSFLAVEEIDVRWLHVDTSNNSRYINESNTSKYAGSTIPDPSLTIMNYGLTDLGSYWCQVQNSDGFGTSKQITLGLPADSSSNSDITVTIDASKTTDISTFGTNDAVMTTDISISGDYTTTNPPTINASCGSKDSEDEAYFTRYQSRHVNVGLLNTTTVRNSLKCALICLQHFTCTGFNYQEITGSCQLTKATLTDLISNNEWDHYLECA